VGYDAEFLVMPFISATTLVEIQTAPFKDVWISARDSGEVTIKIPEKYSADMCGKVKIDYNISDLSFYIYLRVKEGQSVFFSKEYPSLYYQGTLINLTALPEGYNLNLPPECSGIFPVNDQIANDTIEVQNESLARSNFTNSTQKEADDFFDEEVKESRTFFMTGHSFSKENVLNKNNLIYLVVLILIGIIIYLLVRNKNQSAVLHKYEVSNKIPQHKNQRKIAKLKKKIEKYEKEIIRLRQEDLNPKSRERFLILNESS